MLAPSSGAVHDVKAWLDEAGIEGATLYDRGDAVIVTTSVYDAARLMKRTMSILVSHFKDRFQYTAM